ncbi:uncharacterized protein PITG_05965 [Phytophthora infestans T30-4]|uniref:Uncharacterized protein n=1 Tax=Phytophthora infestans (strain T30-4) TaxID=403677 RepID=D0N645_PHYIT|nr:uncharacterized protein PITG_05965 [Phytophthora infestans T30-4]EEY70536.1 conserved hypothetical protein [Phytophthora infestans T30-4]|eukprot:XP_002998190.1 conserved hypothetical protein [Phytophthora infestans T30-4]
MEHSMRYDGYATFVEGHSRFTYALVDGAPYLMTNDSSSDAPTVDCIPPSTLPFDAILPAVNDATPIPSASIGSAPIECESGNLFKTSFAGIHYAICVSDDSGFTAIASDVTIDVDYLDAPVSIPPIKLEDGSTCESHMAIQSTCSCKSTPRPCIFYHGLGNEKDEPTVQDSSRHFGWDIINDHAPCCTTIKYAALNTVDFAWTDGSLQKKVCDRALSMSPSSDLGSNKIKDTIVVTHSMGGLMFAGALANKKCSLDKSSTWIGLSPPMTGSMSSDYLMDFCNGEVRNLMSDLLFDGRCPVPRSTASVAYKNEKYSTKEHDEAYDAAQRVYRKRVYAAMCSSSSVGNISKYQAKYMVGGRVIPHKSLKNDGLVEFHSCAGGMAPSKFGKTPYDRFYRCELNHADTAFKTGDGIFKTTVRPVTWFECLL